MIRFRYVVMLFGLGILAGSGVSAEEKLPPRDEKPWSVDYRFAPPSWQTAICLPDDPQKTLTNKQGALCVDYPGQFGGFRTRVTLGLGDKTQWDRQELVGPRIPIVRTVKHAGTIQMTEEAFADAPTRGGGFSGGMTPTPRQDIVLARVRNMGDKPATVSPVVTVESQFVVTPRAAQQEVPIGYRELLTTTMAFDASEGPGDSWLLRLKPVVLPPGQEESFAIAIIHGTDGTPGMKSLAEAELARAEAEKHWRKVDLPYGHIQVPDEGIQAQLDAAIRNIYQAREIKRGLPAFQVGPTCYRGLWIVDGSFLLEAVTFLGRAEEARDGIRYLMDFQRDDGSFMLIDHYWKETGVVLWAVARHARLTNDRKWLAEVWPKVERGFGCIQQLRETAATDPKAPNYRLMPAGMSDGGLAGVYPEYTNVYWNLAGMRAAIEAAHWLGKHEQAAAWQREYDDFLATFRRAAARDMQTDAQGNRFLPIRMRDDQHVAPQRAQWAFLHAVYPGQVFAADDPLVRGNMAMLRAVEREGLVYGSGWLPEGIWNYFGSFYGHAWLWCGDGDKAARTLYAFANHASPLLAWREEQSLLGSKEGRCGDMPHNWASAEFIRLVRHLLALERGDELHLCEGLPQAWMQPGKTVALKDVLTDFGPLSMELRATEDGSAVRLRLDPPRRNPPRRIVLHLENWAGRSAAQKTMELPLDGKVERTISLK